MKLHFESSNNFQKESVLFDIDRENKKLLFASSKTKYGWVTRPWRDLFDSGKEQMQDILTEKVTDEEFIKVIELSMLGAGYKLKSIK